jgi:serine-type D-Ala-D-Ala carboxypeptidase
MVPLPHTAQLAAIAEKLVTRGAAPSAVIAAGARRLGSWHVGAGAAGSLPEGTRATTDLVFDLASVTKPFTALAAARLARAGALSLSTPLGELLEEARGTPSAPVPLELFLAHRAGLDAHRPLYAPLLAGDGIDRAEALRTAASARRPDCAGAPPDEGFSPVYSDLGYLLAGAALSRRGGRSLEELIARGVTIPVGSSARSAASVRSTSPPPAVAPTEVMSFRGGTIRGLVHDENAWAFGGDGLCGHAGLFGTAADVLAVGIAVIDALDGLRPDWLTAGELDPLVRPRPLGTLRAGFDGKSASGSSAGERFGPSTIGHLGFTGTSLWLDPEARIVAVVLTNRVHPTRDNELLRRLRPETHDAIFDWAAR